MSFWKNLGHGLEVFGKTTAAAAPVIAPIAALMPGGGLAITAIHAIGVATQTADAAQQAKSASEIATVATSGAIQELVLAAQSKGKTIPQDLQDEIADIAKKQADVIRESAEVENRLSELFAS